MGELDLLHEWDIGQQEGDIGRTIRRRNAVKLAKAAGLLVRWREAGGNGNATATLARADGVSLRWIQDKLAAARKALK